ncbi:MAG: glycoside hydrolase family 57 protein [Candidatus Altiarchaeota archaeon]|nr:glycoside hydrolase family 57 protein [Candidatus Altiarchaeota archaeon]
MTSVCLYFQIHQPYRLKWFWPNGANKDGLEDYYFDVGLNKWTFQKVAGKCYWPATQNILHNIDALKGQNRKFKVSYSISGILLEQMERWDRNLLDLFKQLGETGCCEFVCETQYHSLSGLFDYREEFMEQVKAHRRTVKDLLGQEPKVFRNTELLYHDDIAKEIEGLGFKAIMTEGIERILEGWKSPNYLYTPKKCKSLKVLLRNYKLSDDIGYRFSAKWWSGWPLTAEKYADWLSWNNEDTLNIFMDYETFGEHQWEDTGIFNFLNALPYRILEKANLEFNTPSEVVERYHPRGEISVPWYETVSWADLERDPSAWLGNHMQHLNFTELKRLEDPVKKSGREDFLRIWRMLGTSDHYYYMCTKGMGDGSVHEYFSHHGNPFDAAINYHAVITDFKEKVLTYNLKNGIRYWAEEEDTSAKEKTRKSKK